MVNWRSAAALGVGTAISCSATLFAQQGERKLNDAEKKEFQAIVKVVDGPPAGQPASNDLGLTWVQNDLLKAQGNLEYVPFTVSIDASKLAAKSLSFYWRVVSKAPPAAAGKDDKKKKSDYAYEDLSTVTIEGQGLTNISRSFTVGSGPYDVIVVVKEAPSKEKNAPAPKMALIHQSVEIPDLWNGEFTT